MSEATPETPSGTTRSLSIAGAIFLAILIAVAGLQSYRDLAAARAREAVLEERVEEAEARIRDLERRIERLSNDPATLERLAREELGLVKPGDVVVVLPEEDPP